jgi:hypothetical protein
MNDSVSHDKDFCELLFTKALAHYFRSVLSANMDGFNSSTPNPGVWELYVYEQHGSRSAANRSIRSNFVTAVKALASHLHTLDDHRGSSSFSSNQKNMEILAYIRDHDLTHEQEQLFNMFFNIVSGTGDTARAMHLKEYKRVAKVEGFDVRVNVKSIIQGLDTPGAYAKNFKNQQGGAPVTKKLALIASFLPLVLSTDSLSEELQQEYVKMSRDVDSLISSHGEEQMGKTGSINARRDRNASLGAEGDIHTRVTVNRQTPSSGAEGTAVGGALRGGNPEELRTAILRFLFEREFEDTSSKSNPEVEPYVSAEDIVAYYACHPESTKAPSVLSNTHTLATLPTNSWRKLSDGSYQKMTPEGVYKPLSAEECEKLLSGTCAGSSLSGDVCRQFMEAVNSQNEQKILDLLSIQAVWNENTAADSLNKLHPETVIKILKTLKFGTKNGPYGKRVRTVDEWLHECVKGTPYAEAGARLSPSMKSYLEHLVSFVNSNPSLIDPSKRPFAGASIKDCKVFTDRGLYYAGEDYDMMHKNNNQLTFAQVSSIIQQHPSGINLLNVSRFPTMAIGGVQNGGNSYLYTQPAHAQLSIGSGISQLLEQTLNGLKSTHHRLNPEDEAKIREKVARLTTLEQEIYQQILQINDLRLAKDSGINCHSQLSSAQDRLMQLSSVYDRRVPCLQELCEQLRILLAQQQQKVGCEQLE